jgi:dienelactone hydrolase
MTVVGPFIEDRLRFRRRLSAGLKVLQERPECNADRIAAIGYCIGGCGVLELARAGAALRGVVSLHGILSAPIPAQQNAVVGKVLVLHGYADPVGASGECDRFSKRNAAGPGELADQYLQ